MKKIIIFIFLFILNFAFSQQLIIKNEDENSAKIIQNSENVFSFSLHTSKFQLLEYKILDEKFTKILVENFYPDNNTSFPELPCFAKIIEIPDNSEAIINVRKISEKSYNLNELGFQNPIFPNQPWLSKNEILENISKNNEIYNYNKFYEPILASVNNIGKFRDVNLAQIIVNPFSYNIANNTLNIIENLEVEIVFNPKNHEKKLKNSFANRKEFETITNNIWNFKNSKNIEINNSPIKYIVIADRIFENVLESFLTWKTIEGYEIICEYTDNIIVSNDTISDIKNYLQNIYDNANENNLPPSYLLLVGDVEQIPSYEITDGGTHPSDLYYVCFDGEDDFIPEMYYGRLSAQNNEQLTNIINKIINYEKCNFSDISFLENATLIAGYDSQHGPIESNGQINYANNYYFNQEHGINPTIFLHPNSSNQVSEIIAALSQGNSFVNYTAHCNTNRWQNPNIFSTDLVGLTNFNKPFFVMANCCLSAKYSVSECIGETFIRLPYIGAASYIGASELSYWFEDYYWTVGVRGNVIANPSYDNTGSGVFDCLFHENGEEPAINAGQMIFCGNMNVMQSTSNRKKYYWEIYNILGDPSIMPYAGSPSQLTANHIEEMPEGNILFSVSSAANAYVAISLNNVLIDAKFTNDNGNTYFNLPFIDSGSILKIVITKQFHKPYFGEVLITDNNLDNDAAIFNIIEPIENYYSSPTNITPKIAIANLGVNPLTSLELCYKINSDNQQCKTWTGNLNQLDTTFIEFDEISLNSDIYNFDFFISNNNDQNSSNDTMKIETNIYAAKIIINNIISPIDIICNNNAIIPKINLKNTGNETINSLEISCFCNDSLFIFSDSVFLLANDSVDIELAEIPLLSGNYNIVFDIISVNNGINIAKNTAKNKNFSIQNTGLSLQCDLLTDKYASEVSWLLLNTTTGDTIYQDGGFSSEQENKTYYLCLPSSPNCYKFIIKDAWGDGMYADNIIGHFFIIKENNDTILQLYGNQYTNNFEYNFCLLTSELVENNSISYFVYPNPAKDFLYISNISEENFSVEISDILGNIIICKNKNNPIPISQLKAGLYFIIIEIEENKYIKKFIKE